MELRVKVSPHLLTENLDLSRSQKQNQSILLNTLLVSYLHCSGTEWKPVLQRNYTWHYGLYTNKIQGKNQVVCLPDNTCACSRIRGNSRRIRGVVLLLPVLVGLDIIVEFYTTRNQFPCRIKNLDWTPTNASTRREFTRTLEQSHAPRRNWLRPPPWDKVSPQCKLSVTDQDWPVVKVTLNYLLINWNSCNKNNNYIIQYLNIYTVVF